MKRARILLICIIVVNGFFIAADSELPADLTATIENNLSSSRDFSALLTVIKNKDTELEDQEQYYLFRKDTQGLLLLLQTKPEPVKGRAYLLRNNELWLYNPYGQGFSQATRTQTISNSLALVSDIAAFSFVKDYKVQKITADVLGDYDVYKVELAAKQDSHSVSRITLWIEKTAVLPLKLQAFNRKGIQERTVYYHKYTRTGGEIYPVSIYIEDAADPARKTQLIFSKFNIQPIPDFVFTRAYLEEINKE
ncbi:MAG: outer membrane lipoprotein-sorting protein [Spirochaetales bacterium]|nr:outer membrane lipoprotein-sorting protein [Spirochaetales bacterium]